MSPQLPGYRDLELVGEGGLGRVYRAVRASTGGLVAIKELRDIAEASPAWHRARRELDAMLRLKGHPYVVSVEEIVDGPNGPCLVMEYVPGGSLMDRLAHGPLSGPEAVLVGQQIAQALSAAHQVGLVHRDVKPHNVLVGQFGQVKVCDFGIAALARGGLQTQTQALTLAYASPEALDGDGPIGPPADVFSFGATMTHLMTGRKPTLQERLSGVQAPLQANDPALAGVVSALIASQAYRPEDRPTMAVIAATFDQAAVDLGSRRIAALAAPGALDERTIVRPVSPAAAAPVAPVVPVAPAYGAAAEVTVARHAPPSPAPVPPVITGPPSSGEVWATGVQPTMQQSAPLGIPYVTPPPRRSGTTGLLWGALAGGITVALVAAVLLVRSGRDEDVAVPATTPVVATTVVGPATTLGTATTVPPATTSAPAPAPTAPPETPAPVTAPPATVVMTLPTTVPPPVTPAPTAPPVTAPPPTTLPGDLALTVPMSRPACDGSYVAMLGAGVNPDTNRETVQRLLDQYAGSNYLLTEITCSSLAPRNNQGQQIFQVFRGPFRKIAEACAARFPGPTDAYVRILDSATPPGTPVRCT